MNYLAHLFLSGSDPGVKIGNFIGDHVKGRHYLDYAPAVQKGILLHRGIDSFTDKHALSKQCGAIFKPMYGRYSGVVLDVVYDHFLAANWAMYSEQSLAHFLSGSYRVLMVNYFTLPLSVKHFLPLLIKSRRVETYGQPEGVCKTLRVMAGYSSLPDHSDWALEQMLSHYEELRDIFMCFFDEIIEMSEEFLGEELKFRHRAM